MAQGPSDPSPFPRWWLKPLITLVVLLAAIAVAFLLYRRIEPARLARKAHAYLEKGEYREALLTAQHALKIDLNSRAAAEAMVEITEKLRVPEALEWRRRMSELNPGSAPEALAWADTALRQNKPAVAEQALAAVPESARNTAEFHARAGALAISKADWREAEKHYAEAVRLDPKNELHQYNFATIQLQLGDAAKRKAGLETLERLAASSRVQVHAARTVVKQLIERQQLDQALTRNTALVRDPAATFADRLTQLTLLRQLNKPELKAELAAAQKAAGDDAEKIALLMNWLSLNGFAAEAIAWTASFDPKLAANDRVATPWAECLVATKDWAALRKLTDAAPWSAGDELRQAFLARAMREQGEAEAAKAQWRSAVNAASKQRDSSSRLAYLASQWGWREELQETLWTAAEAPGPEWALQMLHRIFLNEGDTAGLLRVAKRFLEVDPKSDAARNNFANLSLLLGTDLEAAAATAAELHQRAPQNPSFTTTHAFALHRTGHTGDGLALLEKLPPDQLREPSRAAYMAILLNSAGRTADAIPFAELAKTAPLLPEEKALLPK